MLPISDTITGALGNWLILLRYQMSQFSDTFLVLDTSDVVRLN